MLVNKYLGEIKKIGFLNFILFMAYFTNVRNYGFLFGYLLTALILIKKDVILKYLDSNFFLLLAFSVTYGSFYALNPSKGSQFILIYILTPATIYLWGKYFAKKISPESLFLILLTFGIFYSMPALISVLINIREGGFAQMERNIPMFWSNEIMNATGMAAYFMFNMCIPAIILVSRKKMNILAIFLLSIIFILSILCILRLGSRTQLGVIALTFLFSFFTLALPTQTFKQNLVSIISILIIGSVVSRYVSFDWDAEWTTSFAGRMKDSGGDDLMSGGGRLGLWQKSLEYLFEKPLGWDVEEFGHSHNLWLDVLRSGGVLSFVTLIFISSRYILLLKRTLLNAYISRDLKGVLGNFTIALFAYFMVEPVFDGPFTFFTFFCFLFGFAFTLNEPLIVQSTSNSGKVVSDQ